MFSLASADTWYFILAGVSGVVGYWLRHQQGDSLPTNLVALVKKLMTAQQDKDTGGLLSDILSHLPGQVAKPAAPVAPVAPVVQPGPNDDLIAALNALLAQRRQQQAHETLAAVVAPAPIQQTPTPHAA